MGTTTNWSLRYPEPTADVDLWTHIQNLAEDVDDALTEANTVYLCKLRQTSAQSVADSTDTVVGNWGEASDVPAWHNPSSNPNRITITTAGMTGWFEAGVIMNWQFTTALQYVDVGISKNGTVIERYGNDQLPSTGQNSVNKTGHGFTIPVTGATNDYFEMICRQTSSGSRNTNGNGDNLSPRFWLRYLGPL